MGERCQVAAKSAADRGGLRVGDILTEIDGYELTSPSSSTCNSDAKTANVGTLDSGSSLVQIAKEKIVGPRGVRVLIKGTRQHLLGLREPFVVSILR